MWMFKKKECPRCLERIKEQMTSQKTMESFVEDVLNIKSKKKRIVDVKESVILGNTVKRVRILLRDSVFNDLNRQNNHHCFKIIDKEFRDYIIKYLDGVPENWYVHIGEYQSICVSVPKWFGNNLDYIVYEKKIEE